MNENRAHDPGWESVGRKPVYSVDENGRQYCRIGDTRIRVTEHFSPSGKTIVDLIGDMILADAHMDG